MEKVATENSLVPDNLVCIRPPYDSTVELGWVMCHGLYVHLPSAL